MIVGRVRLSTVMRAYVPGSVLVLLARDKAIRTSLAPLYGLSTGERSTTTVVIRKDIFDLDSWGRNGV